VLYATTRDKNDVVTAYKAAHTDCNSDGGLFVPFRLQRFNKEQLDEILNADSARIISDVLNLFFSCDLTGLEIEKMIRIPVKTTALGRRLMVAELWHNYSADVTHVIQRLSDRIRGSQRGTVPSNWMQISVRIALLFASYADAVARGYVRAHRVLDVAVTTADFAMPMAAWYARQMGLPIGNIICGCNANGGFWDLLNRGEFATGDVLVHTATPAADLVVPRNLERLICGALGVEETKRYLLCCSRGRTYSMTEEDLKCLQQGMFTAVSSDARIFSIISGVYHTNGYVLSPYTALAYGSLQDYQSMTGHTRQALIVAERGPQRDTQLIGQLLQLNEKDLSAIIGR
jgi:threonine synthase